MSVNELTIKNAIKNLLVKNNTNTSSYDISNDLEKRIQYITSANSRKQPVLNINYPAIFVELKSGSDEHIEMGNSARRSVELGVDIVSVVDCGIGTEEAQENSDDEAIQLTYNLQELFRNNIKLSNTVDSCRVESVEYDIEEGTYNSQSRIKLLIKKRG